MFGREKTQGRDAMALYAVYDRVAEEEAGPCFLAVNDGVAVRNFRALLRNSQVVAEDEYMLYKLGTYDSKTMKVIGEEPVRVIVPPMVEEMKQLGLPGQEVMNVQ